VQGAALLREAIRQDPADKLAQSWLGTALWTRWQMDAALLQLRKTSAHFLGRSDLLFALGEPMKGRHPQRSNMHGGVLAAPLFPDLIYGEAAEEHDWTKAEGHLPRAIVR